MIKKLVQYGGYLLSGILITSLNPTLAISFLQVILKASIVILITVSGVYLLNKIKILISKKYKYLLSIGLHLIFQSFFY